MLTLHLEKSSILFVVLVIFIFLLSLKDFSERQN